ncbi:MAG: SGNH/GDSL hydrolase family protein [Chitinispirillaceae bacterium]
MKLIDHKNRCIQFSGRFDFSHPQAASFDWPGVLITVRFSGTSCRVVLSGGSFFDTVLDGNVVLKFRSKAEKQEVILVQNLENKEHTVTIHKRSESNSSLSRFYGFVLDDDAQLLPLPPLPDRRIEFIGDSHTVGYGNEYPSINCPPDQHDATYMSSTNTRLAYGPITARMLDAQYHVNAVSGKGLVRNYNWDGRGKEFLYYYGKTLVSPMNTSGNSPDWDFSSWIPQVAVINLGINDFQKEPPHADTDLFYRRYRDLLDKSRERYPGVKFICVGSTVTPTRNNLTEKIKCLVKSEKSAGKRDVWYFEYAPENSALDLHPSLEDHRMIARGLSDLISEITGWKAYSNQS